MSGLLFSFLLMGSIFSTVAMPAWAATLDVLGPAGARLHLDGEFEGTLPLPAPIEIEPGAYRLLCTLPGHLAHEEVLVIESEYGDVVVELSLRALRRSNAVVGSAVLAGLGQLYERRPRMGWTMMVLQVGAAITALYGEAEFQNLSDDVNALDIQYRNAVSPIEIARLRAERDQAFDDLDGAESIRNLAIGAVVAVGVWSVVDAWMGFDQVIIEPFEEPSVDSAASDFASPLGVRLAWRTSF